MKQIKRAIALFLVLALCLSLFPSVFAADSSTDIPQGTLDPDNYSAASGEVNIAWNNIRNVYSYTLRFMIKQGNSYYLLDRQIIPASDYKIGEQIKVVLNDWVTTYGPGTYMATLDMEMYGTSSSTPAERQIEISQLDAPTGVTINTDGVVSWNSVEGNHGYEVTVKVGENAETFTTAQDVVSVDASAFIKTYAAANPAADVTATVVALGNLDDPYRVLDSASSAAGTLDKQVGVLPTPVIANPNVVSEGGKLYVEYQLEAGSVDASYIDEITLTLTGKETSSSGTYTVSAADVIALGETGRIDVTRLGNNNLPHDTYTAVLNATPKYPTLNEATSSTGEVTYSVKQVLPAPELEIDNAGTELTWSPVQLSVGELDSTADYVVKYKLSTETDWEKATIPSGDAIQKVGDKFVLDLEALGLTTGTYYDFKVIANNAEDLTIETTSESYIQFFKTNAVSDAAIVADNDNDAVKVTWNNPADTTGIAKYQVDVYVGDEVVKTFYTADASAKELDISSAIDADQVKTYTVKVTAIGQHDLRPDEALFYADSATVAGSNDVTSGTVQAADIVFETPEGASTTYKVYFNGDDNETAMPVNVEGYAVTISYRLKNGGTGSWSGTLNVPFCDIAQLENADGTKFLLASWNVYVDATFTVEATALSNNTALHANAAPQTETDVFSLTSISELLKPQISTDTSGKTWVTWALVEGAKEYAVEVQKNGTQVYKGFANVNQANITGWLNSAGEYTVTVTAYPYGGSTAFVTGSASVTVTVLAAPAEVEITLSDDTATASWEEVANAEYYLVTVKKDGTAITGYENVQVEDTEYVLTDIIKANGAGTYTVEVTAVGDGSEYITSLVPGTATIEITKLTAPGVTFALDGSYAPVVTITPVSGETVTNYQVKLLAGTEVVKTYTLTADTLTQDVTADIAALIASNPAVTLTVEVVATGSLSNRNLSSATATATLTEKVGILPSIEITNADGKIVQDDGLLKVYYKLTNHGTGLEAIRALSMTLLTASRTSYPYANIPVDGKTGYIDVTETPDGDPLPAGTYTVAINVNPKYGALNKANGVSGVQLTYAVNTLPAPNLQVSADGSRLYWEAIPMSDGKAVDQVSEFTLTIKKVVGDDWDTTDVSKTAIQYDKTEKVFYIDLEDFLPTYSYFRIQAHNDNEDVTYSPSSEASIAVSKLADVTTVKIVSQSSAVKATWADSANTAGVSGYRVELLKLNDAGSYDVWKTYTAAADKTSYTFADEDIDQSAVDTYKVRVTALGTKDYKADVFYADANPVESTVKLVSGQLPTVAETGTIYEENGKLYLKVALNDTNNNCSKISSVQLTKLQGGIMTYEPARALRAKLMKATDTDPAYAIFDLSSIYQSGSLAGIEWTATINVVSKNEQLNAGGAYTTTAAYGIEALNMGELSVNSKTGVVSWERVPGATGYKVEVSYNLNQTWTANTDNDGDIITYEIKDPLGGDTLVPGRTYTITVYAYSDKTMENPTGTPATAKLCKLYAPTKAAVVVTADAASVTWTASQTADAAFDHYTVTSNVGSEFETADSSTTSVALTGLDEGAYTFTVKAVAESNKTVGGVYYVDSDAATATGTAYVGTVPADGITDVSITWGKQGKLYFNYQLPVAADDATDLQKAEINAIVEDTVKVTLKSGEVVVGTYTDSDGDGKIDVTYGTGGNSSVPVSSYTNLSATIELESNYELIAGASYDYSVVVPDQGVISFENFNVDVTDGKVTFTGDPHATGYSAVLQEVGSTSSETIEPSAEQRSTVYTFDLSEKLTAGKTYTLTITGTDATGQYKDGVKEIKLYKLVDPTDASVDLKTAELSYTDNDKSGYAHSANVAVDDGAAYDAETQKIAFDLEAALHHAKVTVTMVGGYDEENDVYVVNAANAAECTVLTGKLPDVTLVSLTTNADGNAVTLFDMNIPEAFKAEMSAKYYQIGNGITVTAKTANGVSIPCKGTTSSDGNITMTWKDGTIAAQFGLAGNPLASGTTYTFDVYLPAANAYKGVIGSNSQENAAQAAYDVNKLSISPSVSSSGAVSFNMTDEDKAALDYVEVTYNGTTKQIREGANLYTLFAIPADNYRTLEFTFQAIAKDDSRENSDVTQPVQVRRLRAVTATLNESGKFTITNNNGAYGTYSVRVTGSVSGSKTYTKPDSKSSYLEGATWKTGPFQTLTAVTTTTGGEYKGVYCLSNSEKPATTTTFSVGTLPAVTLGNALEKNGDGEWVIKYALTADESYYKSLTLTLTVEDPASPGTTKFEEVTGANGEFNVNDFVMSNPGTYSYTLGVVAANETLNSVSTDNAYTGPDSYSYVVGQLDAINAQVDTATGKITWDAVDHATSYTVSEVLSSNTQLVQTIQAGDTLEFTPADLTAGVLRTFVIAATSNDPQYPGTSAATVQLYKLVDPTNAAINAKTGELTFTGDTRADTAGYNYVPSVKLSDANASYEDGIVKFDLTAELQEVTTQVYLVGGANNGSEGLYLIQSSGCAEVKTVTGAMPTATLQSVSTNGDGTTSVVFQLNVDPASALWKAAYPNVQAGSASGIYVTAKTDSGSTIVCYDKNSYSDPDIDFTTRTATITATFGLSGNNLTDGVEYTFSVRVPVKTAYKAVFGPTTTENLTVSTPTATKLEVSASVGVDGALAVSEKNGVTEGVDTIWMEVGTPSTKVAVFENGAQKIFNVLPYLNGTTTFSFYAEATDARYEDSDPVEVTVVPMDAPEISFTDKGYFSVSADAKGTLEVKLNDSVVTAGADGHYSYADVVTSAVEPVQLTVAATLTGKTVSDTNTTYLSSSATAQSSFYVGPLPTLVHDSTTTEVDTSETKLVLQVADQTQLWDMIDWTNSSATIAEPTDLEHPFVDCTIAHNDADHTVTITWNSPMSEGDKVVTVSLASLNSSVAKATVSTVEFTFVLDQYATPVIVPGQDGKLSITVPEGAVLAAKVGDGKWMQVTNTNDLLAWLDTVIEDNDTSLHEVQFKFVDKTVTLSMDDVPADSEIITLQVRRLTAPTVDATATDGTFTVTNPNTDPTGELSVKVGEEVVTDTAGTYTVPETILSGKFTVKAQAQVETNPVDGVYYLDSAVTEVNGTKAGTPLDAPVGKITVSKRTIYWNDVENAVSYEVWIDGVKDEDAEFDTTVNGENTHTYTMDLSVGVHEVQIVAVPEANKGLQSTASEVYHVTQLPDMVSAAVNKETGVVTFEVDEYDAATTGLPETNPYGHCRVNVAFSPKTSGSWNSTEKTATYTTNQDATLTYLRVSVGGASFKDEAGVQQYHLMPKTYAQNTEKFYIGELPAFTLESVVENDNDTTTVTFVTESEEDLESILDLNATIATFAYSYESLDEPATEGSWEHTADDVSAAVDGNKLIFTLQTPTSAGYELTYSFTAQPAAAVAAVRSAVESTGTIEYKGNKLSAPTGLKMEIVNGEPVLVWNAVDGAQGYKVLKNGAESQSASECSFKPTISNAGVSVTYSVYAVGETGVTDDSEAADIVIQKVDNSIVTDFTLRSPAVSLRSQRVNYTMTTTNANLKRVLAFTTDNEAVTITHTTDTATTYDVAYSGDTFAEVTLKAYICGEYKDVWYYSPTVKAEGSFIVGPVASNATVSSVTMNKAGSVVVTLSFDGINSSAIDFTNYSCTMTGEDGTPVTATSRSLSGKTLKLTFKTGVTEGTYKLDLTLPVKAAYAENEMLQAYTVSIDTVTVPAYAG